MDKKQDRLLNFMNNLSHTLRKISRCYFFKKQVLSTMLLPSILQSTSSELLDGDSVTVIKDLKVRGSSMVIKRGTKVKSIRLTDNPEEVDCKIEGSSIVLKTCFLKK